MFHPRLDSVFEISIPTETFSEENNGGGGGRRKAVAEGGNLSEIGRAHV